MIKKNFKMLSVLKRKILCMFGFHKLFIKSVHTYVTYECKYCPEVRISCTADSITEAELQRNKFFKEHFLQRRVLFEKEIHMFCPITGNINLKYNPEHVSEDFFIGLRG